MSRITLSIRFYGSVEDDPVLIDALDALASELESQIIGAGGKVDRFAVEIGSRELDENGVYPPKFEPEYETEARPTP